MALFLHEQGYTFLNINKLTYGELNNLVDAWNRKQKNIEKQYKKNKKKSRRK